jgi:hypothetical protein
MTAWSEYSQIVWGLVSTLVAFILGLGWQWLRHLVTHFRARRFWRSLLRGELTVVLGRFRDLPDFEASGVVGAGDNIALSSLTGYFSRIGFRRFTVYYNDQLGWSELTETSPLRKNLILIGGPDANSLTRAVLQRLALGIEFLEVTARYLEECGDELPRREAPGEVAAQPARPGWPSGSHRLGPAAAAGWRIPVFRDLDGGRIHAPIMEGTEVHRDCGVVIRTRNPFDLEKEVLILCGCYGYGTWGAAEFIQSAEFLRRVPRYSRYLECVMSVDVLREAPQQVEVEVLRSLVTARLSDPISVPRIVE